jgi:hypothetical protein
LPDAPWRAPTLRNFCVEILVPPVPIDTSARPAAGIAARLRSQRIRAGKSLSEVAEQLRLNPAWLQDLERRDEELAATLTLFQAMELAALLGTDLRTLAGSEAPSGPPVAIIELPERIRAFLRCQRLTVAEFEARVGWEVAPFLKAPLQEVSELPLEFLQAVAAQIGIDWLILVPDEADG